MNPNHDLEGRTGYPVWASTRMRGLIRNTVEAAERVYQRSKHDRSTLTGMLIGREQELEQAIGRLESRIDRYEFHEKYICRCWQHDYPELDGYVHYDRLWDRVAPIAPAPAPEGVIE